IHIKVKQERPGWVARCTTHRILVEKRKGAAVGRISSKATLCGYRQRKCELCREKGSLERTISSIETENGGLTINR
ncbi:MAG: hypothetical protein P4L55_10825, partial [Syntrophobacteraceae bacterium]|nr:hypothetical protein [Syntrophobacteraceae bacterium]